VEVTTMEELRETVKLGVDVLMLDNFEFSQLKSAIELIRKSSPGTLIEISGGITLDNVEQIARLRPDFISTGMITYSAIGIDMSLNILHRAIL